MTAGRVISKIPAEGTPPDGLAQTEQTHSRVIHTLDGTVVLLLSRLRPRYWPWGWHRTALGSWLPQRTPGLRFIKTLGSGIGGGFGLVPSPSHQAMFCVFDSETAACDFIAHAPLVERYRQRSEALFIATLRAASVRGTWDGMTLAPTASLPADAPVATLTRASIRTAAAAAFWRHAPAAQRGLRSAQGCVLATGLGEAPLLRQATFSLWHNTAAMEAYARTGAHLDAIRAAWKHEFFSESMFVRFVPLRLQGQWEGRVYD
ncbi:MAG: spheroidene monooxygenase [Oxalobacteraceae bacterium]